MIAGIDIGSTTTKAVTISSGPGLEARRVLHKVKTRAADPVTSATGAFGKMIMENNIGMGEVKRIMITGVGAARLKSDIFGIPTERVDEIHAVGIGGFYLAGEKDIIITNIGTGTAIIDAGPGSISHIGGTGLGGGAIIGMGKRFLGLSDYDEILTLARSGDLTQVDLIMSDIMDTGMSFLNSNSTAANFAKMLDTASNSDIALGLVNMVYQVIGVLSVFAARNKGTKSVLVTGSGSGNLLGREVLKVITGLYGIEFVYPPDAEYTTAIGAGLSA
jgi:type II pantothenate kinase